MDDIQAICVRNNAEFCDVICRSHGVPGAFERSLWIQEKQGPSFYPNIITLTRHDVSEQTTTIAALRAKDQDIAIKDSFSTLDLSGMGLRRLFDAEWVWMTPEPSRRFASQPERWSKIDTAADLTRWQTEWRGEAPPLASPVFLPSLLDDPSITILAAWAGEAIVAGCVLNRDKSDVVGLSNLFAAEPGHDRRIAAAIDYAADLAQDSMLVSYEGGDDLARMRACSFHSAGPLRVWG
jgi:DNA-binding transcriptional LysR family regulator